MKPGIGRKVASPVVGMSPDVLYCFLLTYKQASRESAEASDLIRQPETNTGLAPATEVIMMRTMILRMVRLAALAAAVSLAFGTVAWAHDDDDYYYRHDEAREHGYRNGYQDGVRHGQYDR